MPRRAMFISSLTPISPFRLLRCYFHFISLHADFAFSAADARRHATPPRHAIFAAAAAAAMPLSPLAAAAAAATAIR
jgi:hypothetical protein